jgi:beta-galactosidase
MTQFPQLFTWGTATSSYQIEGGWQQGGKGFSIWDAFTHTPGKIIDASNGDVTCDHYHKYKKDIALMAKQGLKAYRFSLSWPRIQPQGHGNANKEGIEFYSDLIDTLLEHDIEPWVTLYHWDLPVTLQLEYDGWLNPEIADFYKAYADICFNAFGDRVKHWITLNEAWVVAMLGYGQAVFAPGRESKTEPYIAAHHLLRAHAYAVDIYRKKYQHKQNGLIGITNNCDWREPLTDSQQDKEAAQRALEFFLGWFADPIYLGAYPPAMRQRIAEKLPRFDDKDLNLIKGSSDFFGLNHYTTLYASHAEKDEQLEIDVYGNGGIAEDQYVNLSRNDSWPLTPMGWAIVPWGCRKLLHWIDQRYDHPAIVITENGCTRDDKVIDGQVDDQERIDFVRAYLSEIHTAIEQGVDVRGYFLWSFMDNFEWASGFTKRFGINYVDFKSGKRIPKSSAMWYSQVVKNNGF